MLGLLLILPVVGSGYLAVRWSRAYWRRFGARWYHGLLMVASSFLLVLIPTMVYEGATGTMWPARIVFSGVLYGLSVAYYEVKTEQNPGWDQDAPVPTESEAGQP